MSLCFPARFHGGAESHRPFARWANGQHIRREQVQEILRRAAIAVGLPPERFMTHSLRVGGASALYHAVGDIEVVKRWGRWKSSAFHVYLWDSHEQQLGVAKRMAQDVSELRAPK